jgi:hypothetical protein
LRAARAEEPVVFFPRSKPLSIAPAHVRGLRLSLNTPVVATEDLPIGPARAAILIHEEPGRGETVSIGIRSLRAERFAIYGIDPEADGETTFDVAVDAALSFAESMGFLFDEDELADGGAPARARCFGLWKDLLGDAPEKPAGEADELLLEDLVEEATEVAVFDTPADADDDDEEIGDFVPIPGAKGAPAVGADLSDASDGVVAAEAAEAVAGAGSRRAALPLSKFRNARKEPARKAEPAAAAAARPGRGAALGKLRLVRRVRDGLRKRNPILRLFGAF